MIAINSHTPTSIPTSNHKAGFVAIIGKPNVGKSTLMNLLIQEPLAITHAKAQTTRHSLQGILSEQNFQLIFIDTPGIIPPAYPLQVAMMEEVKTASRDADVIIWIIDPQDQERSIPPTLLTILTKKHKQSVLFVLNKSDLLTPVQLHTTMAYWSNHYKEITTIATSALKNENIDSLIQAIVHLLPNHPPYYPKETLTDKPERFFAQEIIREKILSQYHQEIPYSIEVTIDHFKEMESILKIAVTIHVERPTQKAIIIGHQGKELKNLGITARASLEAFFQKKIFLAQRVKVTPHWRKDKQLLQKFGYFIPHHNTPSRLE